MLSLADIRDWLKSLDVLNATWSIGRYEAEKMYRVCLYQRPMYDSATIAIGGREATKTLVKHVQVLIHWNKNYKETEQAAQSLYDVLNFNPRPIIAGKQVSYTDLQLPEPADAGSDESGIFDRVIWLDFYFEEE